MTSVLIREGKETLLEKTLPCENTDTGRRWLCVLGGWGDVPTSQGLLANKQARKGRKDLPGGFQRE